MRRLLRSMEEEAELNTMGRLMVESDTVKYLSNRLEFEDYARLHPDVRIQEVSRPIFIVGLPRTGTTILFNLLALDPATRAPLSWEMQNPFPPPREETYRSDTRIADCAEDFVILNKVEPKLLSIHEFDAQRPQECVLMYRHEFLCIEYSFSYKVPGYYEWLKSQDIIPALSFHKQFLQHLQYHYKKERWILKSPAHLPYIENIFEIYPDACIIHTHRDPLEVAASATSLAYTLQCVGSDKVDAHETGEQQMNLWEYSLNKAMEARKKLCHKNDQIIDIYYEDIVNEPFVTIQKIYDKLVSNLVMRLRGLCGNFWLITHRTNTENIIIPWKCLAWIKLNAESDFQLIAICLI